MQRNESDVGWKTCVEPDCIGIRYADEETCILHGPPRIRQAALEDLAGSKPLDWGAGLIVDDHLMGDILAVLDKDSDDRRLLPRVSFRHAKFITAARFTSCKFQDNAHFDSCDFEKGAEFAGAHFENGCTFSNADFRGRAFFKVIEVCGRGDFRGATFHGIAAFGGVSLGSADFSQSRFADTTRLLIDKGGQIKLDACTFERTPNLMLLDVDSLSARDVVLKARPKNWSIRCRQTANFQGSSFEAPFAIKVQARHIVASSVRTNARGRFQFLGDLDASDLDPGTELLVEPIAADTDHGFDPTEFPPRLVSLRRAVLDKVSISSVNLESCLFAGAHRLDQLRLEGVQFAQPPSGWRKDRRLPVRWARRQTIAEEQIWRSSNGYTDGWRGEPVRAGPVELGPEPPDELTAEHIAIIYRALRKGREDRKDIPGGSDFYYGEMEMRRHAGVHRKQGTPAGATPRSTSWAERQILNLYWLISGYGLRASRAFACLIVVLFLLSAGLDRFGFDSDRNYFQSLLFAFESSISLLRHPLPDGLTCAGEILQIILRLTGPLFFALGVLAVRARVKR